MKILVLSELFYPHGGGAELATYLYVKSLCDDDFEITVITNKFEGEPERSKIGNLVIYRLPLLQSEASVKYGVLSRIDVLLSNFMRKLISSADLVYIPRFWYSGIVWAKMHEKPVVTHVHDYIPVCSLSNMYNPSTGVICSNKISCSPSCVYSFEKSEGSPSSKVLFSMLLNSTLGLSFRRMAEMSDVIICVSNEQKRLIAEKQRSFLEKSCVIYNPLPSVSAESSKGNALGFFGGLSSLKGFHILCEALSKANRDGGERILVHATKFTNENKQLIARLKRIGVLVHGKLEEYAYQELQKQIVGVVVPSVWPEPLPYVVTEAMLRRKIVIASRVGGIPEQVSASKGAFLVEPGDSSQLSKTISEVCSLGSEELTNLGATNRELVLRKFDNEKLIIKFAKLMTKTSEQFSFKKI